jgi:(1->4)-alpha-D-glucan 1-alpha-D-glucosylmutase
MAASVFDFIASVLLLEHPPTLSDEQAAERRQFALKFQQVSGPVAAKGVEDTAFYRYYPLASLNEVGGELDAKPLDVDEFHRLMRRRMELWPHSMCATSTHDSKRGEDMRARLNVLTEIPDEWARAFERWQKMNRALIREIDGDPVPDANEEYLIYQTLVGTWPTESWTDCERDKYRDRILQYMEKALREAKVHASWMNPSEAYEAAVREFLCDLFGEKGREFAADLTSFVEKIADSGFVNSLAQLLLKATLPGVPDFYRGTELWDFSLVDPDNRRPVDYSARRTRLQNIATATNGGLEKTALDLSQRWPSPDVKLWMTVRALGVRRKWPDLFSFGEYIPLTAVGRHADHMVSFARRLNGECALTVIPRHYYRLTREPSSRKAATSLPRAEWQDAAIVLPEDFPVEWGCELSGRTVKTKNLNDQRAIAVASLFEVFPAALLKSRSK